MMQASSYIQPAAVVSRRGGLRQQAVVKYSDSQFIADAAVEMSRRVDALARDIICKVGSEHRGWKRQLYELHGLSELSHGNTVRARIRKCANSHSMICAAYQQTQEKLLADAVSGVSRRGVRGDGGATAACRWLQTARDDQALAGLF